MEPRLKSGHPVKNWMILLEQSFTTHMPFMTATRTFQLGEHTRVLLNGVTYTVFCTVSLPTTSHQ